MGDRQIFPRHTKSTFIFQDILPQKYMLRTSFPASFSIHDEEGILALFLP